MDAEHQPAVAPPENLRRRWSHVLAAVCVWLLLVGCSLLSAAVPGINEPHYLSKARAFADPDWCHRDFFLQSQNTHYCFYVLVGPLTGWLSLSTVAVAGRMLSLAVVAWGWCRFAGSLGAGPRMQWTAALVWLVISQLTSFSGEWIVGGFESKVPSWGCGFAAIAWWLQADAGRSRWMLVACGITLGLSVALHPVVGMWCVVAVGLAECVCRVSGLRSLAMEQPAGPGRMPVGRWLNVLAIDSACVLLPCLLTALPGLLPALQVLRDTQVTRSEAELANFIQVFWRLKHHLDPTEFSEAAWLSAAVLLTTAGLAGFALCRTPVPAATRVRVQRLGVLLGMVTLIAAAGVLIGWHWVPARDMQGWEWRAALLRFYPFRLFDGLLGVVTALLLCLGWQHRVWPLRRAGYGGNRQTAAGLRSWPLAVHGAALAWLLLAWSDSRHRTPNGYTPEAYADWQSACAWIREHTPADALFLTPRESFAFKWFAERAEYVVYKDCPQDAAGILEWNRRLWYLNGWTQRSSADGVYDAADLSRLRDATQIDYVVTRILGPFESAPVYSGRLWQIYRVPGREDTVHEQEPR